MSKQSKIPAAELAIFCQELYQLVQSGLPIADGLNMLLEDETDRRTKAWLAPLCAHAEEGMPLAQAMRQTEAFPDYMTDMVALVVLLVPALRARVTGFVRFHLGGGVFGQIAAARFASAMSMAAVPRRHCPRAACFPRGMAVCLRCPSAPVRWLRRWNRSQSACRKIPCVGSMAISVRLSRPLSF